MNAIILRGDKTAHVQLSVGRKQLAGALSYLGANHTSDYDLRYNVENKDGLKVSLECFGVVENAITKALPVGFRLYTLNEALTATSPIRERTVQFLAIPSDQLQQFLQPFVSTGALLEWRDVAVLKKYCCLFLFILKIRNYSKIHRNFKKYIKKMKNFQKIT